MRYRNRTVYQPLFWISLVVWAAYFLLYIVASFLEGTTPPDLLQRTIVYSLSVLLTFGAGLLMFRELDRLSRLRWPLALLIGFTALIIHSVLAAWTYQLLPTSPDWQGAAFFPLFTTAMVYDSGVVSSAFLAVLTIHYGHRLAAQERLTLEKEGAARDAQLATLRQQLSPHFLFNTLNSISALVTGGETRNAERTIIMLSDFLRTTLDADTAELIPLEDEITNALRYVAIEKVRYEDRLAITTEVDGAANQALVPSFLLQPLFENVVKHAVARSRRPIKVHLSCLLADQMMIVRVEDNGPGFSEKEFETSGIGIQNVRSRLQLIYGPLVSLTVRNRTPQGVCVEMRIPTKEQSHA
ncbi:MAG: histidine kinase [Pseudomonadota bacterium]